MPDPPKLVLLVEGQEYSGWTNIQIVRSLDALADTFDLGLVTRGSSEPPPHNLAECDECEILYDGEKLIHGWIDSITEGYSGTSSTLVVSGRSRAGDLVDCTALHKPWRSTPLLKIASDICDPFGIRVSSDVSDLPTERYFKLSEGETAFAALDRLARDHGMRVVSEPDGSVLFTRTGLLRFPNVAIEHGVNVVSASFTRSMEERFGKYIFKAQLATPYRTEMTIKGPSQPMTVTAEVIYPDIFHMKAAQMETIMVKKKAWMKKVKAKAKAVAKK